MRVSKDAPPELLPHKEEYFFTGTLKAAWTPGAQCELFKKVALEHC